MEESVGSPSVPVGRSPFHVKGTTYLGMQDYVRQHVPGGLDAIAARITDPELAAFIQQVFLPVAHYDALPIRPFAEAIAAQESRPFQQSVSQRARWMAERDVTVLHRLLFRLVSPEMIVADRLPKVALRYFDFGRASGRLTGTKRSEISIEKLPMTLAPWFLAMLQGYVPFVLEQAGARNPVVRNGSITRDGEVQGIETGTLVCPVSWL